MMISPSLINTLRPQLIVLVSPVGNYYKHGLKPVMAKVIEDFDRAAPKGIGAAKASGNYAAGIV